MTIRPKHSIGKTKPLAVRPFTDRQEFLKIFQEAVQQDKRKEHFVLAYYGVGGIGKTSLRKELVRLLEDSKTGMIWAVLDFEVPSFREQETALFALSKSLKEAYKIQFPTFDLAYAVYWKKTRPQIPMSKENVSLLADGLIADMIRIIGSVSSVPIIGLIPTISSVLMKGQKSLKEWWTKRGKQELRTLAQLEPKEIAERLPLYWAVDFKDYLQSVKMSAVLFIDSYDALWEGARSEAKVFTQDAWVRELVSQLPEVLWIVCGREKLRWPEYDATWERHLKQHLVGELTDDDARRFLRACLIVDESLQKVIVEASKGVPYYLDLAVDTYFEIRNRYYRKPEAADFAKTHQEVLVRLLRYLDKSEIETLKVLSVPRFWNYSLFERLVNRFKTGYPITTFNELCRFSFINQGEVPETWVMHQLMRESLREHLEPNVLKSVHQFLFNHFDDELKTTDVKNITDEHKTSLTEAFYHGKCILDAAALFNWFINAAAVFDQAAQWKLLIPLFEEATLILEKTLGHEHSDVALSLNNIASLYWKQGNYTEAEPLYKRALEIREKVFGPDHPDVAVSLSNLAVLYWNQGKYAEAELLHKRTLEIKEKILEPDHPDVAQSLNNLANVYRDQGNYTGAEPLYRRALEIRKKILAPDHPDVAQSLNNLAVLYRAQGKYAEAEPLYKQTLEIFEKIFGPEHPDVAASLNNLGLIYWNQGRYAEAELLHKRALAIREKTLGPDHPDLAISLNNLANLYRDQEKYSEAEPLYKKALEIFEKVLGPDHPHVAAMLGNIANSLQGQRKYSEAEQLYKKALAIFEKVLSPDHPHRARVLNYLANLYRDQGNYAEAEPLYNRALGIWEKALNPDHPDVVILLEDMVKLYMKIGKNDEAQILEERVKVIRSKGEDAQQ